jgi:cyclopropane fatty-acyl-phospholipid synthase-like methyltransferase
LTECDWKAFFDGYAARYMQESFTTDTLREADFIVEEMALPPGSRILDMGCGTGRHSVELARRGYRMVGVDLSTGMLNEARKAADAAGVALELIEADATTVRLDEPVDGAICLCEGAFGLLSSRDEGHTHDLAVLASIAYALKPGGKLILTALNGMAKIRNATPEHVADGIFDPMCLREAFTLNYDLNGEARTFRTLERGFVPSELRLMLTVSGFDVQHIYGGTAGNWGRRPPDLDEMEIMAIAVRSSV